MTINARSCHPGTIYTCVNDVTDKVNNFSVKLLVYLFIIFHIRLTDRKNFKKPPNNEKSKKTFAAITRLPLYSIFVVARLKFIKSPAF